MNEIKVLLVEDSEEDAELILRELRKGGYSPLYRRITTQPEMRDALGQDAWDVVLCDHALPEFSSTEARGVLAALAPNVPCIIVSGAIGEERAVELMRLGASDYIMKGNLKRLVPAVQREVREARNRLEGEKAEKELQQKKLALWQAEQELQLARQIESLKDEFIGMVSHELKTPLTVIIGALNIAENDAVSPEQARELIHDAASSAGALADMVDNLLELSRHQSERLELQTKQTQIEPVIREVVQKHARRSERHKFVVDIPQALPAAIVDAIRIERVINNLIENAVKYSPQGGEIKIAVQPEKSDLIISVTDHGIGISPEDQSRLFQPFERLGVHKKYDIKGVGLGLRVCRILVEAHNGRIWVASEKGQGSTFYFTVPAAGGK